MIEIKTPAEQFFDKDGTALDAGYIYVGVAGSNPETSPQALFWDKAGTAPATNPIRTVNGYPSRNGAPSKFYTATKSYSITVKTKRGEVVQTVLDTDSGVFDELGAATGAASVGYDNAASGMAADDVQEAIDELKATEKTYTDLIDELKEQFTGINLFPNPAFILNSKGYTTGTATEAANEETLDGIYVVTSGQALSFAASEFGNEITAPEDGVTVVIPALSVTGGDYACTWEGTGTLKVNGVVTSKGATFTLSASSSVTLTLNGKFSKFQFTRPYSLGVFEYSPVTELQKSRQGVAMLGGTKIIGPLSVTAASALTYTGISETPHKIEIEFDLDVTNSTSIVLRVGDAGEAIDTGYVESGFIFWTATGSGNTYSDDYPTGIMAASSTTTNSKQRGSAVLKLIDTNTWSISVSNQNATLGHRSTKSTGSIVLTNPLDTIELICLAGTMTGTMNISEYS